jgi:membrane peptidoglycan carboxypeptidase
VVVAARAVAHRPSRWLTAARRAWRTRAEQRQLRAEQRQLRAEQRRISAAAALQEPRAAASSPESADVAASAGPPTGEVTAVPPAQEDDLDRLESTDGPAAPAGSDGDAAEEPETVDPLTGAVGADPPPGWRARVTGILTRGVVGAGDVVGRASRWRPAARPVPPAEQPADLSEVPADLSEVPADLSARPSGADEPRAADDARGTLDGHEPEDQHGADGREPDDAQQLPTGADAAVVVHPRVAEESPIEAARAGHDGRSDQDGTEDHEGRADHDDPAQHDDPAESAEVGPESSDQTRGILARGMGAATEVAALPGRWRSAARQASQARTDASRTRAEQRASAEREAKARREASLLRMRRDSAMRAEAETRARRRRRIARLFAKDRARRARRRRILVTLMVAPLVAAAGLAVAAYYVDSVPTPAQLALPESTTIYYADGVTPMARLGTENRTILSFDEMNAAVKQAIVAAEDRTFWANSGVSLSSVVRAAWNNLSGGSIQGGSTITQQYARLAFGLKGVTFARKTREAILAWKMDHSYSKEKILESYLNTVAFGRGAYGIEAAAQAYFGKTTRRSAPEAQQITVSEAMVLASVVKQPEPDAADPVGHPGYDPARGGTAAANALMRWNYVRDGMVSLGYLTSAEAAALQYPRTVRPLDLSVPDNGLNGPTGLVVNHVLSELRQNQPFVGQAADYIRNGGFRIVTTVDKRAQDAAEAAADIRRLTAPAVDQGQPADWQAALVAVEPGTGRVLAYYGGNAGTGADFAGWYYDANGAAHGYGEHPPGSSFKVYDLAEALRQGVSLSSVWDSPAVKEFPNSGRTNGSPAGPVRNSSTATCQPHCTLVQATVASLNVPFFDLTERLGVANVVSMADKAGIDSLWTDPAGQQAPVRVDLNAPAGGDLVSKATSTNPFSTEVGIGQYGVTVLDHANGMATFAAGGERAQAHFVRAVYRHSDLVYAEQLTQSPIGLTRQQVAELTAVLTQVPSAALPNGWAAAGKTGTWQAGTSLSENAHTWMVGYTRALAVAVWLGTTDGKALKTRDGRTDVFGSTHAAPIWSQFIVDATAAMNLDPRDKAFADPAPTPGPVTPAPVTPAPGGSPSG